MHATILIGYLPVTKIACFKESTRSLAGYRLFHASMRKLLASLVEAGTSGVRMVCPDGCIRLVVLILAAYIADYPEQCLVVCCLESRCPRCLVPAKQRGENLVHTLWRDQDTTLDALQMHKLGVPPAYFKEDGIRAVYAPFWADLPHANIFSCMTPDIMHELHKGVFKDHLVKWCTNVIGKDELD